MTDETTDLNAVELATELTIAWLGNPNTRSSAEEVPAFLGKMHDTVVGAARTVGRACRRARATRIHARGIGRGSRWRRRITSSR